MVMIIYCIWSQLAPHCNL